MTMIAEGLERREEGLGACVARRRATGVDTGGSAITMVDQRVCGSVSGGVEMAEEDSVTVEGAGGALLRMSTATDLTK